MKIVDEGLLDTFRCKTRCEFCGLACPGCEPHHVLPKGMGGGGQMDIPCNLIGLCHMCHRKFHDGNIRRESFLAIVAKREKMDQDQVLAELYRVRALPKGSPYEKQIKITPADGMIEF